MHSCVDILRSTGALELWLRLRCLRIGMEQDLYGSFCIHRVRRQINRLWSVQLPNRRVEFKLVAGRLEKLLKGEIDSVLRASCYKRGDDREYETTTWSSGN